ncbi:uncharacterized protein [Notamacropus eugenii]|uniref:uncharacterized protein n=1 Tax=Notamacropus eugenii TaxID=9315 RepID=UPI003B6785ED
MNVGGQGNVERRDPRIQNALQVTRRCGRRTWWGAYGGWPWGRGGERGRGAPRGGGWRWFPAHSFLPAAGAPHPSGAAGLRGSRSRRPLPRRAPPRCPPPGAPPLAAGRVAAAPAAAGSSPPPLFFVRRERRRCGRARAEAPSLARPLLRGEGRERGCPAPPRPPSVPPALSGSCLLLLLLLPVVLAPPSLLSFAARISLEFYSLPHVTHRVKLHLRRVTHQHSASPSRPGHRQQQPPPTEEPQPGSQPAPPSAECAAAAAHGNARTRPETPERPRLAAPEAELAERLRKPPGPTKRLRRGRGGGKVAAAFTALTPWGSACRGREEAFVCHLAARENGRKGEFLRGYGLLRQLYPTHFSPSYEENRRTLGQFWPTDPGGGTHVSPRGNGAGRRTPGTFECRAALAAAGMGCRCFGGIGVGPHPPRHVLTPPPRNPHVVNLVDFTPHSPPPRPGVRRGQSAEPCLKRKACFVGRPGLTRGEPPACLGPGTGDGPTSEYLEVGLIILFERLTPGFYFAVLVIVADPDALLHCEGDFPRMA